MSHVVFPVQIPQDRQLSNAEALERLATMIVDGCGDDDWDCDTIAESLVAVLAHLELIQPCPSGDGNWMIADELSCPHHNFYPHHQE